ncbi:MAG TPA: hypothetical protein VIQ05_14775 [Tardiphaga sp.]
MMPMAVRRKPPDLEKVENQRRLKAARKIMPCHAMHCAMHRRAMMACGAAQRSIFRERYAAASLTYAASGASQKRHPRKIG